MSRRAAGTLVVVAGLALLVTTFFTRIFSVAPAFESISDDFRPVMTDATLAALQQDAAALAAVNDELTTVGPTLSEALNAPPEQVNQLIANEWPNVAAGSAELPGIVDRTSAQIAVLAAQQPNFERADQIPTDDIAATSVSWSLTAGAVIAILLGLAMIATTRMLWAGMAVVLGLLVAIVPFVISMPTKAAAADELNAALRPVMTEETLAQVRSDIATVEAMASEMNERLVPTLSNALGATPEQVQAFVGDNFPAIAAALPALPEALARFEGFASLIEANLDEYATLRNFPMGGLTWTVIAIGIAMTVFALAGVRSPASLAVEERRKIRPAA